MRPGMVFHSLELVVDIVPSMNTLVDVIPKGLKEVVALRSGVVPQAWEQEWIGERMVRGL